MSPMKTSIVLVSPVFDDYTPEFVTSMLDTFNVARARGWRVGGQVNGEHEHEFLYEQGSPHVLARNSLAEQVLVHTTAEHVVWADADMKWRGEDIATMIEFDEDVVGVSAPHRDGENGFVFMGQPAPIDERGLMQVEAIGFGLVVMKRHVIERFRNARIPMFREVTSIIPSERSSEDACFSLDWRLKLVGKIFIYVDVAIGHIGRVLYTGDYGRQAITTKRQDRRRPR